MGEKIRGSFRYDIHAERTFVSNNPTQANYSAYPVAIVLDGKTIDYPYGSGMHLVDWSSRGTQDFIISSDGYRSDRSTNVRISCEFSGASIFGSALSLPVPPNFSDLSNASFFYSVSVPGDLNSYVEKFSGSIDDVSIVVHPEVPEIKILYLDSDGMTVHFYGTLQHSYDLKEWINSADFF